MDNSVIKKSAANIVVYHKGLQVFNNNKVSAVVKEIDGENLILSGYVDNENAVVTLGNSLTSIVESRCTCIDSKIYPGMCKHSVALVLGYMANTADIKFKTAEEAEFGDNAALNSLIQMYADTIYDLEQYRRDSDAITVEPIFVLDTKNYKGVYVQLKVGHNKMFTVKNIAEMGADIRYGFRRAFGRSTNLLLAINNFTAKSAALAKIIKDGEFLEYEGDKALLNEAAMEKLFELYYKKNTQCWHDTAPELSFVIAAAGESFCLRCLEIETLHYIYNEKFIIMKGELFRVDDKFRKKIKPLVDTLLAQRYYTLTFEANYLPVLTQLLGPAIKNLTLDLPERLISQPLIARVYLDLTSANEIEAKIEYEYNERIFNIGKDEIPQEITRDIFKERYIKSLLSRYNFKLKDEFFVIAEDEDVFNFLLSGVEDFARFCEIFVSSALRSKQIKKVGSANIKIKTKTNWIDISIEETGIPKEEISLLLASYRAKKKYYKLKSGEFIDITGEEAAELDKVIQELEIDLEGEEEFRISKHRALYLNELLKDKSKDVDDEFIQISKDFEETSEVEVPAPIAHVVRDYQIVGYNFIMTLGKYNFGGILADDMGLGKTLQMIAVFLTLPKDAISLVVCPTSLVLNWEKEVSKFAPQLKLKMVVGNAKARSELLKDLADVNIVVTSYDSIKRDIELYEQLQFEYCVLDEAHYIKNSATQNAKAVKRVVAAKRMALTGTPIENSLMELWSIFDFIMPGYLYSEKEFRQKLEIPIRNEEDYAADKLRYMISPFILRRMKKDVLSELPEKIETTIYTKLTPQQEAVYVSHAASAKKELMAEIAEDSREKNTIKMLAALMRLRQICAHPSIFLEDYFGGSAKLESALEIIQDCVEAGHKVLLFSQFTSMLAMISQKLHEKMIRHNTLRGDVRPKDRMKMVEEFNEGDMQVFLISLKAGGVGLNLTAADIVIHYDPWWNLSAQNQATDRAYRMGQKNTVQVFKLIAKNTIEEKIKQLQDSKALLSESILSNENKMISSLSQEELMGLFD
ncbi:DEAD/DEAH box helicase [Candidatus Epulonipiscium viviparus]|uniref:DEAD/DEAH box helicase n=1 Tax=Candidatus Epulonipiscium viviparus TaxID=420336 RepID=UPI0027381610|nr:DEAD/DEAH box helicase [Candidatus Epulopiscium viviparus]